MHSILKPVVDMDKMPLDELPKNIQSRICRCNDPCDYYIEIDVFGKYCEKDALELAHSVFALAHGINRVERTDTRYGWTVKEEAFIKDWYNKKRIEYGDIRLIASMLGRPYSKTKYKIDKMRREGQL